MVNKKKTKPVSDNISESDLAPSSGNFPIVGIGASAGGLASFEAFFAGMPVEAEPGMAFVLVQHLAPDHKSILTDLVKRYTKMLVLEVKDGVTVQPNCVYIIPPNHDMALLNGKLHLLEPSAPRGLRLPIDFFFRTLAQDQRERAICIILSGTGNDGTLGLRAIKAMGGMVMAQEPETTEFDGMPRNAIATGLVDYVHTPAVMVAQLIAYAARAFDRPQKITFPISQKDEDIYSKIYILLRSQTGHDFSQYKQNTLSRRTMRRMIVHKVDRLDEYLRFLQQTPLEVEALFHDFLIGVTNFFRDPHVFESLEKLVIPRLFAEKSPGAAIRVWVPGCSTGEEAYSIAILLQEHLTKLDQNFKPQIFATDIDARAIANARSGIFPGSIASDISKERLERFFDFLPTGNYRVHKYIRDLLIFSEQDLIKDPPFSRLDLISCRNVLIYMGSQLQKKLIPLLHYSLDPAGFLLLGTSESIGDFINLFTTVDRKSKIYERKLESFNSYHPATEKSAPIFKENMSLSRPPGKIIGENKHTLRELTERALLQKYAPTSALVNERGEILYLHGRSGRFLEPTPGEAVGLMNILKMAREGLRPALNTVLRKAIIQQETIVQPGLQVKTNGEFSTVNLSVMPLKTDGSSETAAYLYLVILEEVTEAEQLKINQIVVDHPVDADERIVALKQELREKDEYLQNSNDALEMSNEELKSSNEEMQSVNEELQSTNEELETAKEELQSINEELVTVNTELHQKVLDLSRANNDLNNLFSSTGVGTIFVDQELLIQRYTSSISQILNLIPSDVGRPVNHIVSNLVGYDNLSADIEGVLNNLVPIEIEVQTRAGIWFLLRIQPYRTLENMIEGAVITFTEISELKKAQAARQETEGLRRLAAVVSDSYNAITVQDLSGRILAWNPAAVRMFGWGEAEALSMNIRDITPAPQQKELMAIVQQLRRGQILDPYRLQRITKNGQVLNILSIGTALIDEAGEVYAIATTEKQIDNE